MKFRYLVFISILSFCLACQGKKKATLSDLPRPVRVIKVEALGTFNHQYTGTVTARNFSILAFRLPGTLTEVNVNTGQKIKKAPVLYERIQAVLDYISGMTDVYALDLYRKINGNSLPAV